MASIYKPKDKHHWYISYKDPDTGKQKNKSTGLKATNGTYKEALKMKEDLEKFLSNREKTLLDLSLDRSTIDRAFLKFKHINSDKHRKTIEGYDNFYEQIKKRFSPDQPCTVLNKESIENWIIETKKWDKERNTIYAHFKILNKFLNFLFEYNYIPVFKINQDVSPKAEVKEIIIFEEDDFKMIKKKLAGKKSNFKTMIKLLMFTGLRPSDIINLKVDDVDIDEKSMRYYSEKTKEYFEVPIHSRLVIPLKRRIKEIVSGRLLSYSTVGEMSKAFRRYLEDIGLKDRDYNLRTFRKTFATKSFESDLDIKAVASLLGHKTISTTMKYYTKANRKKLAEDLKKLNF